MKLKIILYIFLTTILFIGCQKDNAIVKPCDVSNLVEGWTITKHEFPFLKNARDMHFPTESTGFIVGYNGIIKTYDQGETWQALSTATTLTLITIYFINENVITRTK